MQIQPRCYIDFIFTIPYIILLRMWSIDFGLEGLEGFVGQMGFKGVRMSGGLGGVK